MSDKKTRKYRIHFADGIQEVECTPEEVIQLIKDNEYNNVVQLVFDSENSSKGK